MLLSVNEIDLEFNWRRVIPESARLNRLMKEKGNECLLISLIVIFDFPEKKPFVFTTACITHIIIKLHKNYKGGYIIRQQILRKGCIFVKKKLTH
jgi:hypothetical protein